MFCEIVKGFAVDKIASNLSRTQRVSIFEKIEEEYYKRKDMINWENKIEVVYVSAYLGVGSRKFFDEISAELMECEDEILLGGENSIKKIDKLLWAFAMKDFGTAEFFAQVSYWIKLFDLENLVHAKQLARFCNYFSRISNTVGGGYGLYKKAERRIGIKLRKLDFHELVNIAELLIPQKAASREFTEKLQDIIYEKITRIDKLEEKIKQKHINLDGFDIEHLSLEITVGDLIKVFKTFSGSYTKSTKLIDKIMAKMVVYLPGMSNNQLSLVLWSFVRGMYNHPGLYKKLEHEFYTRIPSLNIRTLVFSFEEFARYGIISAHLFERYLLQIESKLTIDINLHYALKILEGIQRGGYALSLDEYLSNPEAAKERVDGIVSLVFERFDQMIDDKNDIRPSQILQFMNLLADSFHQIKVDSRMKSLLRKFEGMIIYLSEHRDDLLRLQSSEFDEQDPLLNEIQSVDDQLYDAFYLTRYSFDELCQFYYSFVSLKIGSKEFLNNTTELINKKFLMVSRKSFAKVFYALVQGNHFGVVKKLNPIITELHKYGDFKYFFNHEDFIKLIWSTCYFFNSQVYPLSDSEDFKIPHLFSLRAAFYSVSDVDQIFDNNFDLIKLIVGFAQRSMIDLKNSLMEMNPNTLTPIGLKLNIQTLLLFNFLSKFTLQKELDSYLEAVLPHYRNFYLNESPTVQNSQDLQLKALRILGRLKPHLEAVFDNNKGYDISFHDCVLEKSMQFVDACINVSNGDDLVQKIGVIILNEHHFYGEESQQLAADTTMDIMLMTYALEWNLIIVRDAYLNSAHEEEVYKYFEECIADFNIQSVEKQYSAQSKKTIQQDKYKDCQREQPQRGRKVRKHRSCESEEVENKS